MRFQRLLFLAAAATCALLAVLPGSRWLVRLQAVPGHSEVADTKVWRQRNLEAAASHPKDFALRFAVALDAEEDSDDAEDKHRGLTSARQVWALRTCFPNQPALYAAVLRCLTISEVRLDRSAEEDLLYSRKRRTEYAVSRFQNPKRFLMAETAPESLALFREAAEAGARLDPQNSFFPLMQALERFRSNHDQAALAALHRAAEKLQWNDYVSDESDARDRLNLVAFGETGFMERLESACLVSYPHFPELRVMSRLAAALAVQKELAGDRAGGWVIRQDVAGYGVVMRCTSSTIVGSEVGILISETAQIRPGGREIPDSLGKAEKAERSRWRLEQFVAYANSIGHPEDAEAARRQEGASAEVKSIDKVGISRGFFSDERLCLIITCRAVGSALLADILVILVFGGVAFGLSRTPRIREVSRLHTAIRWAFVALAMMVPGYLIGSVYGDAEGARQGAICGLIAVSVLAIGMLAFGKRRLRDIAIFLVSMPAIVMSLTAALLGVFAVFRLVEASPWTHDLGPFFVPNDPGMFVHTQATLAVSVLLPLLWIVTLLLWSLFRRVSVSAGTVQGAAKSALVFASLLLFVYVVMVQITLGNERQGIREILESRRHEGRYYARLAGRAWPELPASGTFLRK